MSIFKHVLNVVKVLLVTLPTTYFIYGCFLRVFAVQLILQIWSVGALVGTDLTKIGLLDNKLFTFSPIDVEILLTNFLHRQKCFQLILTVVMSDPHYHTVKNAMLWV